MSGLKRSCRRTPRFDTLTVADLDLLPVGTVLAVLLDGVEVLWARSACGSWTVRPGQHASTATLAGFPVEVMA